MENITKLTKDFDIDCIDFKTALKVMGMKYGQLYSIVIHKREIPHYKYGKKIILSLNDLEKYKKLHYVPAKG
jgi:hypothetical protein